MAGIQKGTNQTALKWTQIPATSPKVEDRGDFYETNKDFILISGKYILEFSFICKWIYVILKDGLYAGSGEKPGGGKKKPVLLTFPQTAALIFLQGSVCITSKYQINQQQHTQTILSFLESFKQSSRFPVIFIQSVTEFRDFNTV